MVSLALDKINGATAIDIVNGSMVTDKRKALSNINKVES